MTTCLSGNRVFLGAGTMDVNQEIARLEIVIHQLVNDLRKSRHDSPERAEILRRLVPLFPHLVELKQLRETMENNHPIPLEDRRFADDLCLAGT